MTLTPERWTLYACRSSYAPDVAEIIWRTSGTIAALVDNMDVEDVFRSDLAEVIRPSEITDDLRTTSIAIPLLTPGFRFGLHSEALGVGLIRFPPLVDPTSIVAQSSTIGEGSIINAGVVIAASSTIGQFVQVNRSASVGHDADVHDFSTLGPGCILAGQVTVMPGAFIGAGVTCAPEVTIGANAVVGAGAVVVRDVPDWAVVVGNPAKQIREGATGYGGAVVPMP